MNKPSWLSLLNTFILGIILLSHFGIINPSNWGNRIYDTSGIKLTTPIDELKEKVEEIDKTVKDNAVFWGNEWHNLVTKQEFNKYHHLSQDDFKWIVKSIEYLQGTENLSKQIQYYKNKIDSISEISYCYSDNNFGGYSNNRECVENKDKDLKDAKNKLFELQKKLNR